MTILIQLEDSERSVIIIARLSCPSEPFASDYVLHKLPNQVAKLPHPASPELILKGLCRTATLSGTDRDSFSIFGGSTGCYITEGSSRLCHIVLDLRPPRRSG